MLKLEIKKILHKKEYLYVMILICLTAIIDFLVNCYNFYGNNLSSVYAANEMMILNNVSRQPFRIIFTVALPIVASIVASDMYFTDKKKQINTYIITRVNRGTYIKTQALAIFIVVSVSTLAALFLNLLLCLIAFPLNGVNPSGLIVERLIQMEDSGYEPYNVLERLSFCHPYINIMFFIIMRALIAGLFALLSYGISFIGKLNKYVVFLAAFFIYNAVDVFEVLFEMFLFKIDMENSVLRQLVHSGLFLVNPPGNLLTYFKDVIFYCFIVFVTLSVGIKKEEI